MNTKDMKSMRQGWFFFIVILSVLVMVFLALFLRQYIVEVTSQPSEYSYSVSYANPVNFTYPLDKVSVNVFGSRLTHQNDSATITALNDVLIPPQGQIVGFKENSTIPTGSSINYQLTTDYTYWYYFDGTNWVRASEDCGDCVNTASEINENIRTLPVASSGFRLRVFMESGEVDVPVLHSVEIILEGDPVQLSSDDEYVRSLFTVSAKEPKDSGDESSCECDGKVSFLELKYNGLTDAQIRVEQHKGEVVFDEPVTAGATFAFTGVDNQDTLGPEITIFVDDEEHVTIHTSCSEPIDVGLVFEDVEITDGASRNSGPFCGSTGDDPDDDPDKVAVCHSTSSETNPYVFLRVNQSSVDGEGVNDHTLHEGDIIGITDLNEDGVVDVDDCSTPPGEDEGEDIPICHATGSESNPYTFLLVDENSVDGEGGNDHSQHEDDIIPISDLNGDQEVDIDDCNFTGGTPPVAVDDVDETLKNIPVTTDILDNDSDPDGFLVPATTTVTRDPDHGDVTINSITGESTYTPDVDYFGVDSFDYVVCDNDGLCDEATVTITILSPPIAANDDEEVEQCESIDITVLGNDSDPDGAIVPSTTHITVPAEHGTLSVDGVTGVITYTPECVYSGPEDTFSYEVCDDDGLCDEAIVTITINPNLPPVAEDDAESTNFETPVDIDLLFNDSDPDGVLIPATTTVLTPPTNGGVIINPANGVATYTPNVGFYGQDAFTYEVCDNDGACDDASVTIEVNHPPTALDDSDVTDEGVPVTIDILLNDFDVDGVLIPSTTNVTTDPLNGGVSINSTNGEATYTPNSGFTGIDSFIYEVCDDDGLCDEATVTIGVGALVPPVANDDSETTPQETPVDVPVLDNDSDADGVLVPSTVNVTTPAGSGITSGNTTTGEITYTPNAGFFGNDTFVYEVCDDDGLCDEATVTIDVNAPPVAEDDAETTPYNTPIDIVVLANDSDPDGFLEPSTVDVLTNPSNGFTEVDIVTGVITYTPNTNFAGIDTFTYEVCDNDGACDDALVTITIEANLPPVAEDDFETTNLNTPVRVVVLSNDSDPDGFLVPSTVEVISGPSNGSVVEIDTTGEVIYYPDLGFDGVDTFIYRVCDNDGACDEATVEIGIESPLPPVALDDFGLTDIDTPVTLSILGNDFDPDGTLIPSTVSIVSDPANGTITDIDPVTGDVTYLPNSGFSGIDIFVYEVCDNDGLCDTATVTIGIGALLPPVAADDSGTTPFETPISIAVTTNDSDPDGVLVLNTLNVISNPSDGTVSVDTTIGLLIYVPDTGFSGVDTFDYEICDNDGLCDTATVTITVLAAPAEATPTIVVPDEGLTPPPFPAVSAAVAIDPALCGGTVYTSGDILLTGSATADPGAYSGFQYSTSNGLSWINVPSVTGLDTATPGFSFTLNDLTGGDYSVFVRTIAADGTTTASVPCLINVDTGLVFGANEFVLDAQAGAMSQSGTVQFIVNRPQVFHLEAKGATKASVHDITTDEEFVLEFDKKLQLWTGELAFQDPGFHPLEAKISNVSDSYSREINTVFVAQPAGIIDFNTGETVESSIITIYEKDVDTGNFQIWNGGAFGQVNPVEVGPDFALYLPTGEFYIDVESPGYRTSTSLITNIEHASVVRANVRLSTDPTFVGQVAKALGAGGSSNFPLEVTPLPPNPLLEIGEIVPDVFLADDTNGAQRLSDIIDGDKPVVMMVYSTWNTAASEQINIFTDVIRIIGQEVQFLPIATLEPDNKNEAQVLRGEYELGVLKPGDSFYDDYSIISLPQFFLLDQDGELQEIIVGSQSVGSLTNIIRETFNLGQ